MTAASWIQTRHGVAFDLLDPRADNVRTEDVAHHLSRLARFTGATTGDVGYSVAQHSVLVADLLELWGADARLQREGLLHDAGEAYYGDWTSPAVRALCELGAGDALAELRRRIDVQVRAALGLDPVEPAIVKRADLVALAIERKLLMVACERAWELPELADTRWTALYPQVAVNAEAAFLERLAQLDAQMRAGGER